MLSHLFGFIPSRETMVHHRRDEASLGGYYGELATAHTAYPRSPRQWRNQGNDLRQCSLAATGAAGAAGMYVTLM